MKYLERKERILSMLDVHETVTVQQIIDNLKSSPATVRRDIARMEEEGELARYWGGIKRAQTPENRRKNNLANQAFEEDFSVIGKLAASQLRDNEMIFIGSGTTTLSMIPYIQNRNIHVITNGIPQLEALHRKNIQALLLCGFFKEYSKSLVGKETLDMLRKYQFDRAFLGANGINDQLCLLSADEYEDGIKKFCIRQSREAYLLVGKEKFHRTAYYAVPGELSRNVTIITNYPEYPSEGWREVDGGYTAKGSELLKGGDD